MRSELEQYQNSIKEFNESTRLGFESFIQSNGSDRNKLQLRCTPFTDKKGGYGSFDLDFGLSVYQHQQSKVDELQKRVDAVKQEVCVFANFIKRFDEHTDTATIMGTLDGFIEGLEQALKGVGNETN